MTTCIGTPAEENALAYIEGTLPEIEAERFEEHYFECPVCLAYLQAIQAVGQELAHEPAVRLEPVRRKPALAWPALVWALGAAAALLVIGVAGIRFFAPHPAQPSQAQLAPATPAQTAPAPKSTRPLPAQQTAMELADLALPAFEAPNLRGAGVEANFEEGMSAYGRGDCQAALSALARVSPQDLAARQAQFFSAACRMHKGDLAAAAAGLHKIADEGDSPEQESVLYYLAQIALARNDPATAHRLLLHSIALKGDLERRARVEDQKVLALINRDREAGTGSPDAK
jgi:hypothetical protein